MNSLEITETAMKTARKGTTTVGLVCSDGVLLAADKKATSSYIENRYETKVFQINKKTAITTAGSVGDLQYLTRLLRAEASLQETRGSEMTTKSLGTLLSNILQGSKFYPYLVMILVAGYDEEPALYSIDPIGGMVTGEKVFVTGSGGPIALGVLDSLFKEGMTVSEAANVAVKALKAARERDLYTGGVGFNIITITKDGLRESSQEEVKKLIEKN
ncbi:MAG: proteasome subunit beta [archaeon]